MAIDKTNNYFPVDKSPAKTDPLDSRLASFLCGLSKVSEDQLDLSAIFAHLSKRARSGDVCVILQSSKQLDSPIINPDDPVIHVPDRIAKKIKGLKITGKNVDDFTPLILENDRLYLKRYHSYEKQLLHSIENRITNPPPDIKRDVAKILDDLFPLKAKGEKDDQRTAAIISAIQNFTVITGGPGTGKTTTVVKILAFLLNGSSEMRIALCAPTGKAAARLQESISNAVRNLPIPDAIKELIPTDVVTLHRLLGAIPGKVNMRYNRNNRLPVDLLVADEASMIDLPLLTKTMEALPDAAKVILIGDHNQLASVEAGAVLGDICSAVQDTAGLNQFSKELKSFISEYQQNSGTGAIQHRVVPEISDCVVELRKNYRFGEKSGIGMLSLAIRDGDFKTAVDILKDESFPDVSMIHGEDSAGLFRSTVVEGFGPYIRAETEKKRFDQLERFRILSPFRGGKTGVENINSYVTNLLRNEFGPPEGDLSPWYDLRPIMIKRNDRPLGLNNGDIGFIRNDGKKAVAIFHDYESSPSNPKNPASLRAIPAERLPSHESCYVMTVHKSQGSEFDEVVLLLPEESSPILTIELIYTAVTRAKKKFLIFGTPERLKEALGKRVFRVSGLRESLHGLSSINAPATPP